MNSVSKLLSLNAANEEIKSVDIRILPSKFDSLELYKNFLKGEWLMENYLNTNGNIIRGGLPYADDWVATFDVNGGVKYKPLNESTTYSLSYTMSKNAIGYRVTSEFFGCTMQFDLVYGVTTSKAPGCGGYAYWMCMKR